MKRLLIKAICRNTVLALYLSVFGMCAQADVLSDWRAAHPVPKSLWETDDYAGAGLKSILVGGEYVRIKDLKSSYHKFSSGEELICDGDVWRLVLKGGTITQIAAYGQLAIELASGTSTSISGYFHRSDGEKGHGIGLQGNYQNGYDTWSIHTYFDLLIYGAGTLDVHHAGTAEDGTGDVNNMAISVGHKGWSGGSLTISGGSFVSVHSFERPAVYVSGGDISIAGAVLEVVGGGVGIYNYNNIVFDNAIVNVLSGKSGINAYKGNLTIRDSFCTSISRDANALHSGKVLNLDNSIVYALSRDDTCVEVSYDTKRQPSVIGKGLYKFTTLGGKGESAIEFGLSLTVNGGELVTCAPNGYGMHSTLYDFTMNSGLIRNQHTMNIKDEFVVSRELMNAYGLIAGWEALGYEMAFNPYNAIELFLGSTLLDWVKGQGIETPTGNAYSLISTSGFYLNGGTVLSEATEEGVIISDNAWADYDVAQVKGGSLLSGSIMRDHGWGMEDDCAIDANATQLVCVTNVVAGKPYSRVTSGWTARLPSDYDTSSLYLDGKTSSTSGYQRSMQTARRRRSAGVAIWNSIRGRQIPKTGVIRCLLQQRKAARHL